jgi:hypothetical protein
MGAGEAQSVLPLSYGLKGPGFESQYGVEFFFPKSVYTHSGVHPASYLIGSGVLCSVVKWSERELNHSSPSSAEVKN